MAEAGAPRTVDDPGDRRSFELHRVGGVLAATVVGAITGAVMASVQHLTVTTILGRVKAAPLPVIAICPVIGLLLAAACLRWLARGASPAIADEYIRNIHDPAPLAVGPAPGRVAASIATIGLGGALGMEAVALYAGGAIGTFAESRLGRFLTREDSKMLMVAGAAAGVAAIFHTPVTGAVFALEVPFRGRLGRRHVVPVLAGSLAGYVTAVAIVGDERLFPVRGHVHFSWRDLAVALVLGIVAGAFAHVFARVMRSAKSIAKRAPLAARIPIAGALMAGIVLLASTIAEGGTILGPGYVVTRWALDPTHSVGIILGILLLRTAASAVTLAGGGVGGLFIPLVAAGALTGRAVGGATGHAEDPMYAVVGAAAFLAAGYRVPLAAITFVAETTGRAGFIVPAMVAAFAAEITMGTTSVSAEQRDDAEAGW